MIHVCLLQLLKSTLVQSFNSSLFLLKSRRGCLSPAQFMLLNLSRVYGKATLPPVVSLIVMVSRSRLKRIYGKNWFCYLLGLVVILWVGRVAESLSFIVLAVLHTRESLNAIAIFKLRVALWVDAVVRDEKLIVWCVVRLDVLPASAAPSAWHKLNVRKALWSLCAVSRFVNLLSLEVGNHWVCDSWGSAAFLIRLRLHEGLAPVWAI